MSNDNSIDAPGQASAQAPVVVIASGALLGRRVDEVLSFKGVPYAANPYTAERRFQAPQPMPAWPGIRDAACPGPMPPQPSRAPGGGMAGAVDDLTLNLWAPAHARQAPVLVWLPGGAFYRVDASESWYDGSAYARQGVVVVVANYRVGIDGFLWLDGLPANRGLMDQVAVLQWVQHHIAAFGGDPGNVTLAGQSAGAQSVLALMGLQSVHGLFHKAIAQSPPLNQLRPDEARCITAATAACLKVAPSAQALAAVPMPELIAGVDHMVAELRDRSRWGRIAGQPPYLPVLDGTVLSHPPLAALSRHARRDLPLLVGSTDEEARLYLVPGGAIDRVDAPAFAAAARAAGLPDHAAEVYAAACAPAHPKPTPGDLLAALESDRTFRIPALRCAEHQVRAGAPVWSYQFGWPSAGFGGRLGAGHAVDVPYAFNTLASAQAAPFLGGPGLQALGDTVFGHWLRFVKTGDPGWPRYELDTRPTMRFDKTSAVVADPLAQRRRLWADVAFD
jgi:para-nitrobenzyl esterase